jgi:hypothetical protein
MVLQNRLKTLAVQVKIQRENGSVSSWSEEIKKEAVYLMGEVGISKLIEFTCLPRSLIYVWRDKLKNNKTKIKKCLDKKENIFVTRISSNNTISSKNELLIASVERSGITIQFYCKNTAKDILERFLK